MDMLVKLYSLPSLEAEKKKMEERGYRIVRALPPNRISIVEWVKKHSSIYAASEAECCFAPSKAPTIFIALKGDEMVGYACYNATAPDFFGPMRVKDEEQGNGVGRALLLHSLNALKEEGYAYAIIGSVGPTSFYEKSVNAIAIPDSTPGIYKSMFKVK